MPEHGFVHLTCHSTYSLLEALPSPEEIVLRAKELGHTAVGLTDLHHVYGLIEFYKAAVKEGVKPILGLQCLVRFDDAQSAPTPLTLLAESNEGYRHLLELATESALKSDSLLPVLSLSSLQTLKDGLILLTGPLSGAIPQAALKEDHGTVRALVEILRGCVGKDHLYFELIDLPNLPGQQEANQQLIALGRELKVPVVATCNAHYCRSDDADAHDILLCIQHNAHVADPSRRSMRTHDLSMRPTAEMLHAFHHVPEAIENTLAIAERCNVSFDFSSYHIPSFPVEKGATENEELARLCAVGFKDRYPKATKGTKERLQYELSVIQQVGFAGYFLIVADFVAEAKRRGITVGPGRGSAAGSIVSYCLGITGVDPLAYDLLFERFLNPERISMPDIDLDFADDRRDEVLDYVRKKYGSNRVAQICTFGTLAARAAVKDVGRAFGIPFLEMNNLAKLIPDRPGTKLADALQTSELRAAYTGNETYRRIIDTALKLEGKARHVSVHACGVIIAPEDTTHYTALQRAPKDDQTIITQYGAKPLEALGLLKMDFLGLMNLTVIQTALLIIERTRGEKIDIERLPLNDGPTFALLQRGDTTGVFQLESAGMRRYLKQLVPTMFTDIAAMVALYRPGPMEWIGSFIKRKHGRESVQYQHDDLRPILEPTFGVGIYQEQILQIAQAFAGFTLGEADLLRRAIGKKIKRELDAQRDKFIVGAVGRKYQRALAERIFDDVVTPFAGYGFNKSHAVGYALIAYQTAYLKANYPAEFMAALLSADSADSDRVMIEIEECRAMGLAVLPPDINESRSQFTAIPPASGENSHPRTSSWSIRFGLSAVKGIGESSVREIITEREAHGPFTSLEDFARRVPSKVLNKKFLESLAKSGALDALGERRAIVEHYDVITDFRRRSGTVDHGRQEALFQDTASEASERTIDLPKTTPATAQEKLAWEKETLGLFVSSHPLAGLKAYMARRARLIGELAASDIGKKVHIAGILTSMKKMRTKKGETMAILTIEDPTGKIDVTLFPRTFTEVAGTLEQPDSVLVIGGTIDLRMGAMQMRADALKRTLLSSMIQHAKEEGLFDAAEAARGPGVIRRNEGTEGVIDLVDEEGNVIAGEAVSIDAVSEGADGGYLGPLARWIVEGWPAIPLPSPHSPPPPDSKPEPHPPSSGAVESGSKSDRISIYTVTLPPRAPRQLLIDLRKLFQTFPGLDRVRLRIGTSLIDLPITISRTPILEQKIEELLGQYGGE